MGHAQGALQEFIYIHAHQHCWNQAEIGKGRVAPADIGEVQKRFPVSPLLRPLDQWCTRIRDDTEILARPFPFDLFDLLVKIIVKGKRLGSGAGFAGDNEKRIGNREQTFDIQDGGWIGGIENGQWQAIRLGGKGTFEDQGRQAAAAHAHVQYMAKTGFSNLLLKGIKFPQIFFHFLGDMQPPEGIVDRILILWITFPKAGILLP